MSKTNKRDFIYKEVLFSVKLLYLEAFIEFIFYFKMKMSFVIMIRDNYNDYGPEPINNQ